MGLILLAVMFPSILKWGINTDTFTLELGLDHVALSKSSVLKSLWERGGGRRKSARSGGGDVNINGDGKKILK